MTLSPISPSDEGHADNMDLPKIMAAGISVSAAGLSIANGLVKTFNDTSHLLNCEIMTRTEYMHALKHTQDNMFQFGLWSITATGIAHVLKHYLSGFPANEDIPINTVAKTATLSSAYTLAALGTVCVAVAGGKTIEAIQHKYEPKLPYVSPHSNLMVASLKPTDQPPAYNVALKIA